MNMTVVLFSSETMTGGVGVDPLDVTADELKVRRSEIAVLEARCGADAPQPEATGWQRWLFPIAAALLALGFALALPESTLAERGFAACQYRFKFPQKCGLNFLILGFPGDRPVQ